ncbi:MAG TPA: ribosome biogenesis GTPase Der [Verrucomicrobiae bacterium]|nr:ribosome biogenesis GTPase Der [Verrucomicrobiae bacterium]
MKKLPIVAIVGRANVGKSSLFNAILNRREAIVAREAGTTRDSITAKAIYRDQHFWLVDTAGMKDAEDEFEFTIQEQILQAADSADIIWVVIEANTIISEEDRRVAKLALKSRKPVFLVVNKIDKKPKVIPEDFQRLGIKPILLTSTTQNRGIEDLLETLVAQIPKATLHEADDRVHLAILGRPNVGKSAMFNSLAKKQQAIVADRAGTTRDVNRATVRYQSREIEIMDTAGIRRSGKIGQGIERFSVVRALAAIEQADVALMLMDANELNVALDQKIAGLIKEAGKGLILVVSKWDSVHKDAYTRDALAPQIAHNYAFVPWAPLIFTSSITGQNVTKLFDLVLDIVQKRQTPIKTTELNRWLQQITDEHPPAGLKNRAPKLNYIVQEKENPTNFKVYGSHTKYLHWSYKRFMDRRLREAYGFEGTPIRFWFFEKHETHKHGRSPTKD